MLVVAIGLGLISSMWVQGARPAAAATAQFKAQCLPGSGPPCQQAFLQIDKATGKVTGAVALPGENKKGGDYDAVVCQGTGNGKCFLAANGRGLWILTFNSLTCEPTASTAALGDASPTFTVNGLAYDGAHDKLYALKGTQLFVVDQTSGAMTKTTDWLGVAAGGSGAQEFAHVTALTFDPATGNIFGVEARGGRPSFLFRIDPASGKVVHDSFGPGQDYTEIAPVGGRNEVRGIVVAGDKLYATMALWDVDPHLAVIDPATGATTDIGSQGVPSVGALTVDGSGQLYGTAASGGAVIEAKPCPAPVVEPVKLGTVAAPVHPAAPDVLGVQLKKTPAGVPTLPVTGSNAVPLIGLAAMCYLFGAGALALSRRKAALSES